MKIDDNLYKTFLEVRNIEECKDRESETSCC